MNKLNIEEFHNAVVRVRLAFLNSPTKGASIFQAMLMYNQRPKLLSGIIDRLLLDIDKEQDSEKKELLSDLKKNLEFISKFLTDPEAINIVDRTIDKILDDISYVLIREKYSSTADFLKTQGI